MFFCFQRPVLITESFFYSGHFADCFPIFHCILYIIRTVLWESVRRNQCKAQHPADYSHPKQYLPVSSIAAHTPRAEQRYAHSRCHGHASAYSPHCCPVSPVYYIHDIYHMYIERISKYQHAIAKQIYRKIFCKYTYDTSCHKERYVYNKHPLPAYYIRIRSDKRSEHPNEIKWQHHPAHIRYGGVSVHSFRNH